MNDEHLYIWTRIYVLEVFSYLATFFTQFDDSCNYLVTCRFFFLRHI